MGRDDAANSAPVMSGTAPDTVVADQSYTFTPSASDADGDTLTGDHAHSLPEADMWGATPLDYPCNQPPWGTLAVVNLETRETIWRRPLGTTRDVAPLGLRLPNLGGTVTTRGPVTFVGATKTGRQYVVIAAGGHGSMRTTPGDYIVAFALPEA